jgi:hypothetical protein
VNVPERIASGWKGRVVISVQKDYVDVTSGPRRLRSEPDDRHPKVRINDDWEVRREGGSDGRLGTDRAERRSGHPGFRAQHEGRNQYDISYFRSYPGVPRSRSLAVQHFGLANTADTRPAGHRQSIHLTCGSAYSRADGRTSILHCERLRGVPPVPGVVPDEAVATPGSPGVRLIALLRP